MELEEGYNGSSALGAQGGVAMSIIGAEDEDFENDIEPFQHPDTQTSLFQNLEILMKHPAYLMVFIQHVVLQFDSSPVLCYLHVDLILNRLGPKEAKKQFVDFCHAFLDKTGLLRVPVPNAVQFELDRNRPDLIPEDQLKKYLQDIQSFQEVEISQQLEDFREKRKMGMTPGEKELFELEGYRTKDKGIREAKEKQLAEQLMVKLEEMHLTISADEEKSSAIYTAIVTYMKHLGVKTKTADNKKSKANFFRKKISGTKKPEEALKPKKGFSILDPARWNRGDSHWLDSPALADSGDSPVAEQALAGEQLSLDESAENERRRKSLEPGGAGGGEPPPSFLLPQSEEFEPRVSELELDPPNWRELVPPDTLLRLKKSEVKRQEVINELFITEHAHLRMLRVLLEVFYQPLLTEGFFTESELVNIFPSLEDLIDEHKVFLENMKRLREENNLIVSEIGSTLLARFNGSEGNWFQKISSRFCSRQSFALEQLKAKQKKETRFNQFIQEAESKPRCRRLQLKDIIPIEMQRLTKYPLLLHSIAKCTEEAEERQKVEKAAECCRQILNHVNQEVRVMENLLKLKDYQRRLDLSNLKQSTDPLLSEFRNTDITKRNLVYEGPLTWRVTKDKSVDVHVLLLDDILVLLQKQEERLVLKCHSRTITPTPDGKQMLSPIIKLNSAMTREVATDIKAFYVIFSWENGAQIYELVAQTVSERKNWCNIISDTAGSLKLPTSNTKPRLSVTNRISPHSPSYYSETLLGGAENGGPLKEALQSEEQEKDGMLEGGEFEERNPDGGAKMDKVVETFMTDLQTFCRSPPPGQASLASSAQDRVLALKRLLQIPDEGEALFPVEPTDLSPENGDPQEGEEEWNGTFRIEGDNSRRLPAFISTAGSLNGPPDPEWSSEHLDKESPRFSIVLSLQQSDGVKHHLKLLEDAIQGLKDIETEYWRLQQLVGKFTSSQQSGST
uniref:Rho guanine nucleotide exchange factor 1 n=1 Tax=Laticauda laticaudata TaxID=8630 RepID=A0A8C5RK05_LATLA